MMWNYIGLAVAVLIVHSLLWGRSTENSFSLIFVIIDMIVLAAVVLPPYYLYEWWKNRGEK